MTLHAPDGVKGHYRGTRFDWAGVFESIEYRGCNYAGQWFESYSPTMHDAVCGPSEEFSPIGADEAAAGEPFLKIGVGMLEKMEGTYDRFKLHRILDNGSRSIRVEEDKVEFGHVIDSPAGYGYDYVKEIRLLSGSSFRISHRLSNTGNKVLAGDVYNHNFFTLGLMETGNSREIDFPFRPEGDWRADYTEVGFTDGGIRFTRTLQKGESVFTGNLHEAGRDPLAEGSPFEMCHRTEGSPNGFTLRERQTGRGVKVSCRLPMTKAVFWSNHRIACVEPYIDFRILPGETLCFDIDYELENFAYICAPADDRTI